jgi:hypothetical protein
MSRQTRSQINKASEIRAMKQVKWLEVQAVRLQKQIDAKK